MYFYYIVSSIKEKFIYLYIFFEYGGKFCIIGKVLFVEWTCTGARFFAGAIYKRYFPSYRESADKSIGRTKAFGQELYFAADSPPVLPGRCASIEYIYC